MSNIRLTILNVAVISAVILCFEIIATRISSVIFVNNYAFMILSLAILGLACGGIYAYYRLQPKTDSEIKVVIWKTITLLALSLLIFIAAVTKLPFIQNPFVYFFLLFLPFFFGGIFYARIFETFATESFKMYAADLAGAAFGSVASILALNTLDPGNAIILLAILGFCSALTFKIGQLSKLKIISLYAFLIIAGSVLLLNGSKNLAGNIPIGDFPEKDFHYTYPHLNTQSIITDSRWSIFGRSDLVEYSHQNRVKHLFVDGAAGSQMLRFDGNLNSQDPVLSNLLLSTTSFIPFLFLSPDEKNSMLVIGPGGGKEVLSGLVTGVNEITGVEINPDFVDIVKDQRSFNGGIYTDFPSVNIHVQEGRQYAKKAGSSYDLIVMALPSTQQLQSIDNFALNENYLLTVEAIQDYLDILTPEGQLVFTLHNPWELKRLVVSVIAAFSERGIDERESLNHFMIVEKEYAPTIVIKKNSFTRDQLKHYQNLVSRIPEMAPTVTYLPSQWNSLANTSVNYFLSEINNGRRSLEQIIQNQTYDVSASYDDKPYFYKIEWGVPANFKWLFFSVFAANLLLIGIPLARIRRLKNRSSILKPLAIFISIGAGFMILEISLFQKLILFLGSPTVSLSILLSSLLVGMGTGSFYGNKFYAEAPEKRIFYITLLICIMGIMIIYAYPLILNKLLVYDLIYRAIITFLLLLPLGFLLGIPFPSSIQLLEKSKSEPFIPWMYGVNGAMSVLGSILAVIFSMLWGFTPAFLLGLSFYFLLILLLFKNRNN
ncbi:MAG: hypothetical protein WD059_07340 [Balneolaceae bacterium]